MALINNNYVLVTEENIDNSVDITNHPTEEGLPLADTVRRQPVSLSLSGKIVDTGTATAGTIVSRLKTLQKEGSLITYIGQAGTIYNLQIQNFNTNYNNKNNGGADFDMSLKEARIAKMAFSQVRKKKVEEKPTGKFKVNDTVQFTGGYVYLSSDAAKWSAKRGASQCVLTKISKLAVHSHSYHLISKDCTYGSPNYVYGWVDASCVKAIEKTVSTSTSSGGKQQTMSYRMNKHINDF